VVSSEASGVSRVDFWLWCVRAYRTRQHAKQACLSGHVRIEGKKAKPAATIRVGHTVTVTTPAGKRTLEVLAAPGSRVSAADVPAFVNDLTPPSPQSSPGQSGASRVPSGVWRERGLGRPTKKDRRSIDQWRQGGAP